MPPLQLSTPRARILAFGWAPPIEEEFEASNEGEDGEESDGGGDGGGGGGGGGNVETVVVLRLWVTIRRGDQVAIWRLVVVGTWWQMALMVVTWQLMVATWRLMVADT